MGKLEVNIDDMRTASTNLSTVHADFDAAQSTAESGAESVGHTRLASVLVDFANNWTTHRTRLLQSMGGLSDSAKTIADTFEQVDADLANKLKEGMSSPTGHAGASKG